VTQFRYLEKDNKCVISDFRRDVDEVCALLGHYAALSGSAVSSFRDDISVPSSRVKTSKIKYFFLDLLSI
jgi:hypothetical protein